ncbi:MAG: hypothetical protein LBI72_05630 [Flavobacteriaceae bacterium]|jgi:hypothetical protein|nr:hypothetical protein [Flavobacteriaceae bacterium]
MKELDLLKKHWNENQQFPKVSTEEIHKMIHKKSSSIVLWILCISIVEFLVLNVLSYFFIGEGDANNEMESPIFLLMIENIDYISAGISLFFIALFSWNYKNIHVASSTSLLMRQIIKTKKTVNYYIYCNLTLFVIAFSIVTINVFYHNANRELTTSTYIITIGILLLVCLIFLGVVWLYYKLIYGLLINKLMKNYKELEKIDYE